MDDLKARIGKMSNDQISEILFKKEDWTEEAYDLALAESNRRGLDAEVPTAAVLEKVQVARANADAPLDLKWKILIVMMPFGLVSFILQEKFHIDGMLRKAKESKEWMLVGLGCWLIIPILATIALGLL